MDCFRYLIPLAVASIGVLSAESLAHRTIPLFFEPLDGHGQKAGEAAFLVRPADSAAVIRHAEIDFSLHHSGGYRLKFAGANRIGGIRPLDRLTGFSNRFIGNDPAQWQTGIPRYGRIQLSDVYRGID